MSRAQAVKETSRLLDAERQAVKALELQLKAEADKRKAAARKTAESEHGPLSVLDAAYGSYTAAVAARVAAEESVDAAMAAEDAAEAKVQQAVRALLPAEAGPSGVVKSE